MGSDNNNQSLFRRITVPTENIPRVEPDEQERKHNMARHVSLNSGSEGSQFQRRAERYKKARQQDQEEETVA